MLKEYLLKEPILKYLKPDQPYILYTDASKYAWAGVLTQAYMYKEEGKEFSIHRPITYVSGLFNGSPTKLGSPYQGSLCNLHGG